MSWCHSSLLLGRTVAMSGSRRKFLKQLGAGALGSAALLLPGQASAWHRGRRGVVCVPAPVSPPVIIHGPPEAVFPAGPVTVSYPYAGGTLGGPTPVYGNGAFCTWR